MDRRNASSLLFAACLTLGMTAVAGNQAHDITLAAGSGWAIFDDGHYYNNSSYGSLTAGYNITDRLGIELTGMFAFPERTALPTYASTQQVWANGVYRLWLDKVWQPYLTLGVNIARMNPNGAVNIQ